MDIKHIEEDSLTPPPEQALDEGYWQSLLMEGDRATPDEPDLDYLPTDFGHATAGAALSANDAYDHLDDPEADWYTIEGIMARDEALDLKVVGYNQGGLLVEWRALRGFVPASQLIAVNATGSATARRNALVERVGDVLHLRVIELDADKNRLIFSERAAQVACGARAEVLHSLSPGDVVSGLVTNLCDFGAFIDLGGVEGLIHISEMSWGRVGHPDEMLRRGETVDVYVLDVHPDEARVALSLKRLHPDPWATVEERYHVGQIVEGEITNVVDFGAFACIEEGLEGLIHFSELAEGHFLHPRNVVSEGDMVQARILNIDGRARRLGLSLRLR